MQDPDVDRRSRSLLGWIRRRFDKDWGSDWHWYDWWDYQQGSGADWPYRPRSRA